MWCMSVEVGVTPYVEESERKKLETSTQYEDAASAYAVVIFTLSSFHPHSCNPLQSLNASLLKYVLFHRMLPFLSFKNYFLFIFCKELSGAIRTLNINSVSQLECHSKTFRWVSV